MRVIVTGVKGQLGFDVCRVLNERGIENRGVGKDDFDITDAKAVMQYIENYAPDAVIHCAAWTAVDKAEENPAAANAANVDGTRNIAVACKATSAKMLYISTDYVFEGSGEGFYETDDVTEPLSIYGRTKLDGELAVKSELSEYFIVRTSWTFGKNGGNFVKTMLKLAETKSEVSVVCDQIGSPTYTADLAPLLCDMILTDKYGVYHATNEGVCSWADFAEEIFRLSGKDSAVKRIAASEYPTLAKRPLNSRLSKKRLDERGFKRLPDWRDALERYLKEII